MSTSVEPLIPKPPAANNEDVSKPKPNNKRPARPNYAYIHRNPLPLQTHPLPAFHPTHPLSLLRLAYTYLSQILSPPSSHSSAPYIGYYSPETGAIHITDPVHIRALWEMGFFGKGTLSRSEPSWMDREKARLQARRQGGMTAEEATNARRAKRRDFKLERARLEAERIARQRDVEEGRISAEEAGKLEKEVEEAALLKLFAPTLDPSEPFLINYAVYHHFRSLGWIVRPGIKFGVDYLLYYRGPVFSHAEFAVIIIPSYPAGSEEAKTKKEKDWWWLHCVNRVQSQVLKSLVLCYVDVPATTTARQEGSNEGGEVDVGNLLRGYKVREFVIRRWVANRMRD